jgi:hypothetical protein
MEGPATEDPGYHLDRPARPHRAREDGSETHWLLAAAAALLIGAAGAATFLVLSTPSTHPATPPNVTVDLNTSEAPFPVSPEFWGGNIGTSSPLSGLFTGDAAATSVDYYRWPGGQAGDGINYTTGVLTNATSGAPSNVATNLSSFAPWCVSVGCHAILELPAEIDEPATAADYVAYTVKVLGFQPSYWEIGNEPALWTHFAIPWSQWNSSQDVNATPAEYAQVVRTYDLAILSQDPGAAIIGLGGVGTGASEEASWIEATVAVNGPNLSAVAIHVYPAGTPPTASATLAQFYANLTGPRSLAMRVPVDRAAILSACFTCTHLKLLVTEFGSASAPGSFSVYASGFPQVPFVAHELVEGLNLGVTGMYLRQLETPHGGSWIDSATGATHPLYDLYTLVLPLLGAYVVPSFVTPADPSVAVAVTETGANESRTVLVVNANATEPVTVHMGAPFANPGAGTLLSWNASTLVPTTTPIQLNGSSVWQLPPMSLIEVLSGAPSVPALPGGAAPIPGPGPFAGEELVPSQIARPRR